MSHEASNPTRKPSLNYLCYFCRYFQCEKGKWGCCKLFNVPVNGKVLACQVSLPFFTSTHPKD